MYAVRILTLGEKEFLALPHGREIEILESAQMPRLAPMAGNQSVTTKRKAVSSSKRSKKFDISGCAERKLA